MKSNTISRRKQKLREIFKSFILIKLAITATAIASINIQSKKAFAFPNLVAQTNQSNSELESYQQCNDILNYAPLDVKALLCRANASAKLGNTLGALRDYSQALRLDPTNPEIYYQRAILRSNTGDMEGADNDYTQIIEITPSYRSIAPTYVEKYLILAYTNRGLIRSQSSSKSTKLAAIKDFSRAIALDSNYAKPYMGRASALSALADLTNSKNDYIAAESDYSKYLFFYPDNSEVYYQRGLVRQDLAQLNKKKSDGVKYAKLALKDYDRSLKLDPNQVEVYYSRGILLDDLGYMEKALLDYEKVLDLNPQFFQTVNVTRARGYHERGIILARLAEKLVHRAEREVVPKEVTLASYFCDASIDSSVERTRAYTKAKNLYDKAIRDYREAIRYDTNLEDVKYAKAFRDRGYINSRLGNSQEAIRDFEQAIYIKSKYAPAYFARGCVRADNGDYQEAIQDFNKAIRYEKGEDTKRLVAITQNLNPDFDKAEAYFHRGLAYANLDQHKKAVEDYNKALKNYHLPQIKAAKYHYARANALYQLGKYQKAKQDYTHYLSYYADAPYNRQGKQIAEAYRKRADVRFELGETQGAIEDYNYYAQVTGETLTAEAYFTRRRNLRNHSDK